MSDRLRKNYKKLFWIEALLNLRFINVVVALFYISRGMSLEKIMIIGIVWAVVNLVSEVPSSYLADKWGRKKTIILGVVFAAIHGIILIFGYNSLIYVAIAFLSLSFSCLSGTKEAILYDTTKQLGDQEDSLKQLGKFFSANKIFKIFTFVIGALIAKDLAQWQFILLLGIDLLGVLIALLVSCFLVEPNHQADVEKMQAGIIKDAYELIKKDPQFIRSILSKTLLFIGVFIVWRYHQPFFVDNHNVSILVLSFAVSIFHAMLFAGNQMITKIFPKKYLAQRINIFNALSVGFMGLFVLEIFWFPYKYLLLATYILFMFFETVAYPLYSQYYNRKSNAYNRATTLSLTTLLKSLFDIPLLLIAAWLIHLDIRYPAIFTFMIGLVVILFFRLKNRKK